MVIIDPPAALKTAQVVIAAFDTLSETRRVYSGIEDRLDFGGEWWGLQIVTPFMAWDDAADVSAWCDRLRDDDAAARVAPPSSAARRGTSAAATFSVASAGAAGSRALAVEGMGAGLTLGAGSFISIADRLHRLRVTATADGAGAATLELFPRLRSVVAIAATVAVTAPKGLWRLQGRPDIGFDAPRSGRLALPKTLSFLEALA